MSKENDFDLEADNMLEMRSSTFVNSIQFNEKNVTIIWCHSFMNISNTINKMKETLRTTNNYVLFHNDIDSCISDIKSREKDKIYLITSSNIASELLPKINGLAQLDSVFLFPENRTESDHFRNDYRQIVGISDHPNDLLASIQENVAQNSYQLSVLSVSDHNQRSTRHSPEQSAEFLWFQLFKEIIQCLPYDEKAKEEMLNACRDHYKRDQKVLNDINDFDQTYCVDNCINWYTRATFVFRMINEALRTEDIQQLCVFRFYIADLSRQLAAQYKIMKKNDRKEFRLYRGSSMSRKEMEKLKAAEGQLISANSYWSTSLDQSCARLFVTPWDNRPDMVPILFEIHCDLHDSDDSVIFADISSLSRFDSENEILFDAGSIFKIEQVREESEGDVQLYIIQIRASRKGRELAKQYIEDAKKEMEYESPRIMLGLLIRRIGEHKKSLHYFEQLEKHPANEKLSHIYYRLSIAYKNDNRYEPALECLNKAYNLICKSEPPEEVYSALIRHNLGQMYFKKRNLSKALKYYEEAVDIVKKEIGDINRHIAKFYMSMGRLYLSKKDYENARDYQEKALKIRKSCFLPENVTLAVNYNEIAKVYSGQKNFKEAIENFLIALELRKKYYPSNHHFIAWSLQHIGKMYLQLNDLSKALEYYKEALVITRKCPPPSSELNNILKMLEDMAFIDGQDLEKALEYRCEALELQLDVEPINYSYLVNILENIAMTYKSMNREKDSERYYQQAWQIQRKKVPINHSNLARLLDDIAFVYKSMDRIDDSLRCYHKALQLRENNLSSNDFNLSQF